MRCMRDAQATPPKAVAQPPAAASRRLHGCCRRFLCVCVCVCVCVYVTHTHTHTHTQEYTHTHTTHTHTGSKVTLEERDTARDSARFDRGDPELQDRDTPRSKWGAVCSPTPSLARTRVEGGVEEEDTCSGYVIVVRGARCGKQFLRTNVYRRLLRLQFRLYMYVCMYICMYVHTHRHRHYMHTFIYTCINACMHAYIHTYVCMYVCTYA